MDAEDGRLTTLMPGLFMPQCMIGEYTVIPAKKGYVQSSLDHDD
jgi:hypothetical protein